MELPVLNDTSDVLPPLYARWMDELLPGPIPAETEATCDDCAMCAKTGDTQSTPSGYYFDPSVKCCTYFPDLPNFIVGMILADEGPGGEAGRRSIQARFESNVPVTPLGIGRSPAEAFQYQLTAEAGAFGRNPDLRCPHYVEVGTGQCGIWKYRNSVCATWFCKHVRGRVGHRFWKTVQQLLAHVEMDLMHWCIAESDLSADALCRLLPSVGTELDDAARTETPRLDGALSEPVRVAVWGNWVNREAEFFVECGRKVAHLSWHEVEKACGPALKSYERITADAYRRLRAGDLPKRLRAVSFEVDSQTANFYRVNTYNALDPVDVPRELMQALHFFDGRPTLHALEAIASDTGLHFDESTIRTLVDFGVLRST